MQYLLVLLLLTTRCYCQAQDTIRKKETNGEVAAYIRYDRLPEAPYDYLEYIRNNVKYPVKTSDKSKIKRVGVRFTIEADGSFSNVVIIKSFNPTLDSEAIRVIKSMPKWLPAIADGKPIPCPYSQPVIMQY